MDKVLLDFENLKISAFSKYSKLTGDINNVTIGPNSTIIENVTETNPKKFKKKVKVSLKQEDTVKEAPPPPVPQVIREFETQRRRQVQQAVDEKFNQFEQFTRKQKEEKESEWFLKQQAFIQGVQDSEATILQALNQQDANKSKQNEKLVKHYQDMIQRRMLYQQQLEKSKEKQRILNENIEKIKKHQMEFRSVYQEIITIIKSCTSNEELRKFLGDSFKLLKTLPENFEEIIIRCKSYSVDDEQLIKAANVVVQVRILKAQIEEIVTKINTKKKEETKVVIPPLKRESAVDRSLSEMKLNQCISTTNLKRYTEMRQFLLQHSQLFKELLADEQMKQFRFDCKKAVNIPVNAISAVNAEHLKDKYVKLNSLLSGRNVSVADKQINASRHPQGIPFCMDLLAKKFVLQGDLMISSNPEAAFCYATIIISLWNDFPDFGKLVLGYFYTECPYLVPYYIPKMEEQTDEEYYMSLGYHHENGQIEKQDKFLKRMTGILRLYFTILIAKPRKGQVKNPHDINYAWNFLVSILKLEPQLDITATVLHIFLETIGFEMEIIYGSAFRKLVRIIVEKFMTALKKIDSGGPVTRLEVLLQDYKVKGRFEKPHGILASNFW